MRKVYVVLVCSFMLTSCITYQPTPKTFINMIDYSAFTKEGIYVTESNSVNFDYKAIGSICIEELGGWSGSGNLKNEEKDPKENYYIGAPKKKYIKPNIQEAFKKLMDTLSQSNANGIINMKIIFTTERDLVSKLTVDKIIVSGMAIKR